MRKNLGLYRGKREDTGHWKEGYYLCCHSGEKGEIDLHIIVDEHGEYHRVDPETVGEYVGFVDDNEKKIFEGDICHFFGGAYYGCDWEANDVEAITDMTRQEQMWYLQNAEHCEVIGNIHEEQTFIGGVK